ncbi:folylpolyglutamate synthase/dihydrofolate synthase family protein [uncultured Eudoraea sp.]|uniref:bifunctional folylpolyglutamate synthase/dihydrofolate synthase n=1 Tax=uncultured Eudoraea sp. TaxID=1035614 RepID=UPI00260D038C|nr:folylpolyglutamate synthase/dihydrofolate synthase family protein [uncultured Eudoraea sp.]
MTYKETLDWMFAQLPMYQQKGPKAYNGKLDNSLSLAAHLKNPHLTFKSIHVAGTNGKGSSSHMLASVLQEAGYKVGLYTSPHMKDFRERIKINGKPISEKSVIEFIEKNKAFLEKNKLSFFEMSVGMAFDYFSKKKVSIAIIEVGLGGRLDSTNIIKPEVSLITNIGLDHTDILGDTLAKITREKAGIIKPGIPVVISECQDEIAPIFEEIAKERNSDIVFAEKEDLKLYKTSLLGSYQNKNMKGVLAAIKRLKGFAISEEHIKSGLMKVVENTGLLGRWQVLQENPKVVCDTAHNSEGLTLVLEQVKRQEFKTLHIVLGFVKEKNLDVILPLFPKDAIYYFARPDIPRGLDVEILGKKATEAGLKGSIYDSIPNAYKAALSKAAKDDFIYIGGSTFTVAEVL